MFRIAYFIILLAIIPNISAKANEQGYVTIYLDDGNVLVGKVINSDDSTIQIEPLRGGRVIVYRNHIKEIKEEAQTLTSRLPMVYDDEGKIITEEEIIKEMNSGSRSAKIAGCIGGCGVTLVSWFLAMMLYIPTEGGSHGTLRITIVSLAVGGPILGVCIAYLAHRNSEYIDRDKVIKKIKEHRRIQKQYEKESLIPESKITLTLLSGSF